LLPEDLALSVAIRAHYVEQDAVLVFVETLADIRLQSLELGIGEFSLQDGVLYPVEILAADLENTVDPFLSNVIDHDDVHDSPSGHERFVLLVPQDVLLELVELQAYEFPVRDIAFQLAVLDSCGELFLKFLDKDAGAVVGHIDAACLLSKMLCPDHMLVEEREDGTVDDKGLEDVGDVQVQGEPALVGRVHIPDARVQVCLVDLAEDNGVEAGVAKAEESIQTVLWRAAVRLSNPNSSEEMMASKD